jgi:hypothetical protein
MPMSDLQRRLIEKAVAKLAPELLDLAASEFGSHGCNDLDFEELGLSRAEQEAFVMFMNEHNGSPEDVPDAIKALPRSSDFAVMYACAEWIRRAARTSRTDREVENGR